MIGYVFLVIVVVGIIGYFHAQNQTLSHNQLVNRVQNVSTWCNAINKGRDYERGYFNGTQKGEQQQVKELQRIIKGDTTLPPKEVAFAQLYLETIKDVNAASPRLSRLHPYKLGDLNCTQLELDSLSSGKIKNPRAELKKILGS